MRVFSYFFIVSAIINLCLLLDCLKNKEIIINCFGGKGEKINKAIMILAVFFFYFF